MAGPYIDPTDTAAAIYQLQEDVTLLRRELARLKGYTVINLEAIRRQNPYSIERSAPGFDVESLTELGNPAP